MKQEWSILGAFVRKSVFSGDWRFVASILLAPKADPVTSFDLVHGLIRGRTLMLQ